MTRRFTNNLFGKIGMSTLAITLVLLLFLFYYLAFRIVRADNNAKTITARLTSQAVVDKIDRNFYERFGDVQAFAFNKLAQQSLESGLALPDVQLFINTMTTYYVLYDLMMICDLNGKVLVANTVDKKGASIDVKFLLSKNYSQESWFKVCTSGAGPDGGAWYSDFIRNRDVADIYKSDGYGMAFAAPIRNDDGQVIGVWYNFASWKEVTESIRSEAQAELQQSDTNALIMLTKNTGRLIDASNKQMVRNGLRLTEAVLADPAQATLLEQYQVTPTDFVSGWGMAHGAYTYNGNGWRAVTLLSKSRVSGYTFFSADLLPVILVSLLLMTAVGTYIYFYFQREIIQKINEVKHILEGLAAGELIEMDSLSGQNEIGEMLQSLSYLVASLRHKAAFSDEIAKGNLDTLLQAVSSKDILGNALLNMRDKLKEIVEEDRQRNWTIEGLAKFGALMRSSKDVTTLCDTFLFGTVRYLHAHQGALFVTQKDEIGNGHLELVSCYAYDRKKYLNKKIQPGQGLVGQAYLEKNIIYLTNLPSEYVTITSGLGDANPAVILIVPLQVNGTVEGILELASFEPYTPFEIEFAVKLAEDMAVTLATAQINEQTRRLLEQSQLQTEILRAQEEEMQQNMEEMQATQEEYHRKEREYHRQIQQLQQAVNQVER